MRLLWWDLISFSLMTMMAKAIRGFLRRRVKRAEMLWLELILCIGAELNGMLLEKCITIRSI